MLDTLKRKVTAKAMGISDKKMAEVQAIQRQIAEMQYRHEENGIVVKMSGDMKVQYLEINGEARDDIRKAINKTCDKMQHELNRKMMESGSLGDILGGLR